MKWGEVGCNEVGWDGGVGEVGWMRWDVAC